MRIRSSLPKLRHWVFHAIQNLVRDRLVWPARLKFRFPFPGQRIGKLIHAPSSAQAGQSAHAESGVIVLLPCAQIWRSCTQWCDLPPRRWRCYRW
jgi:hypothetical protein